MTAEIAIANKHAVALAADSKVTIGGATPTKTYDTVNKVFTLSKVHPIGIMIFGNAEFMEYPWETIIKLFRTEKGQHPRKRVQDWANDFRRYVEQFGKISRSNIANNIQGIIGSWLSDIEEQSLVEAFSSGISVPSPEYVSLLIKLLDENRADCVGEGTWANHADGQKVIRSYRKSIVEGIGDVFPKAPKEVLEASLKLAVAALLCNVDSPQSSGYVIAGFGDDDMFPTIIEDATDGYVGPTIKSREINVTDVSRIHTASIRAFAQKDMVQSFMNGADLGLMLTMSSMFGSALVDSCLAVLDEYGVSRKKTQAVRTKITDAAYARTKQMIDEVQNECREQFSNPIMSMVSLLPKDELANMAESLVALTSLKRRVTRGAETVGGPIDVALISKGDGFIWIKRKHYFKQELNPQFVRNY